MYKKYIQYVHCKYNIGIYFAACTTLGKNTCRKIIEK